MHIDYVGSAYGKLFNFSILNYTQDAQNFYLLFYKYKFPSSELHSTIFKAETVENEIIDIKPIEKVGIMTKYFFVGEDKDF